MKDKTHKKMQEKLSLLTELIKLADADNSSREEEYLFMQWVAGSIGVSSADFNKLFDEFVEFTPPKLEVDRIIQFQRMVILANVDGEVDENEIQKIREMGLRMALNELAVDQVLAEMEEAENGILPADRLVEIFKIYHN
jgi:uncharacterized tellurite resistance protein B-like protein